MSLVSAMFQNVCCHIRVMMRLLSLPQVEYPHGGDLNFQIKVRRGRKRSSHVGSSGYIAATWPFLPILAQSAGRSYKIPQRSHPSSLALEYTEGYALVCKLRASLDVALWLQTSSAS